MTTDRRAAAGVGLLLGCVLSGCGGGGITAPRTAPVAGTVLLKGKPAAGVRVRFHPKFDMGTIKFTPSGLTDKQGRFTLSTAAAGDGAPPGDYAVSFDWPQVTSDRAGLEIEVDAWKGRYADPAAGRWLATVRTQDNQLEPFRLE